MKKLFVTISLVAAGMFAANAQDGLPVKGDYSIGVNANPFLNYVGGLLSNAGSTAPNFLSSSTNPLGIRGRYFTADNKAVRVDFVFGTSSSTTETPDALDNTKRDEVKTSSFQTGLTAGMEYKRFKGRVIASYGPQIGVGIASGKSTDYFSNTNTTIEKKGGNAFQIGAGGFIGVEYFFTKNISLGGEFGLNLNYVNVSEKTTNNNGTTTVTDGTQNNISVANSTGSGLSLSIYF